MESMESQHADEAARAADLLASTAKRQGEAELRRIRRARAAIVALKRCGYLEDDEEIWF